MGYYVVSNRFTLKAFVGRDYTEPSVIEAVSAMRRDAAFVFEATPAATTLCAASAGAAAAAQPGGASMNRGVAGWLSADYAPSVREKTVRGREPFTGCATSPRSRAGCRP
ncbi:hypothetical protein [Paraburkholderia sp. LEh10]|uniref:hypothetical protein n=1 Tax=Paraburkholderia sp. LEh10 TaxID=2821353 RepID=UPI001FD7D9BA|nr:hypothetical protein [Paraburkholderia sp. LEh10]